MSVTIRGMKMPKTCIDCPLGAYTLVPLWSNSSHYTHYSYVCTITHKALTSTKRNRVCPLEEQESEGYGRHE